MAAQIQRFAGTSNLPFSAATKADGLVYVAGTIVAEGDVRNQTRRVLESLDATLQKAGSSLANAASVHVYLKTADDFAAMNEVYRTFWKADPPVRTTIVADFVVPNALVEIARGGGAHRRRSARSSTRRRGRSRPTPTATASRAATRCSSPASSPATARTTAVVEGDMAAQTKAVLDNGAEILKAAGMGFEHVVSSRVFITDVKNFQAMNDVYRTYFPKDPPARATVVVAADGAAVPGRDHDDRGERAQADLHHAGRRRHARASRARS